MATNGDSFPAAKVEKELNPGQNKDFEVDSKSSDIAASKEIKERGRDVRQNKDRGRMQTLKTTILVSAVIVAVVGAGFAIAKKLREK